MNLGIRDAISLGPVLAAYIAPTDETRSENDTMLEEYAATRRQRAFAAIQLTKRIMAAIGTVGSTQLLHNLAFTVICSKEGSMYSPWPWKQITRLHTVSF